MINKLNFTVGPVQSSDGVLNIGSQQVPYFRTPEFSEVMLQNETLVKKFTKAPDDARVIFITGSGTASMEASIINTLSENDKAIVVNGGSFGHRFCEICELHKIPFSSIDLPAGKALTADMLHPFNNKGYTVFVVNVHETSTGVHYDMKLISDFCKRNNLFLIVDAISSFLAADFDMAKWNVDIMITGSQKALACPPGISVNVLSKRALERVEKSSTKCMYLDFKSALKNAERGQTPFTPAVSVLLQINQRLREIDSLGGVEVETARIAALAKDFRQKIAKFDFEIVSESMSNAVTPLHPKTVSAYKIFTVLKDEYDIWVCPNGGELADKIFRVGHIGHLTTADNDTLIAALDDMKSRGIF